MKLIALALIGAAAAQKVEADSANGTPCTASADCGDTDKMCCGMATGGKVCVDDKCATLSDQNAVNIMACNVRNATATF